MQATAHCNLQPSDRGMHLLREVPVGIDDEPLARSAQAAGVMLPCCRAMPCNQTAVAGCLATRAMAMNIRAAARVVGRWRDAPGKA